MSSSCRWLVFEPQTGGHRSEFTRWLLAELGRRVDLGPIRFVLPHEFARQDERLASAMAAAPPGVEFVEIPSDTVRKDWPGLLNKAISDADPDQVLVFELTPWEGWLSRHPLGVPISGIMFVQYPELDWSSGPWLRRIERWVRFRIKERKTALWLARQNWRSVFLLNGARACDYLNRRFARTPVFHPIPDPAPEDLKADVVAPGTGPKTAKNNPELVCFLYPGVLSCRKGADLLLRTLMRISSPLAARATFCCVGGAEPRDRRKLEGLVQKLRRKRPDVRFEWIDRYIPEAEFQTRIREADWILAPYRRTEYSSGIFARAAAAGTPIIGPADGLLGRLIRERGLGITSETSPSEWAMALENAATVPMMMDEGQRQAFLQQSRGEDFARQLLDGIERAG